MKEPSAKRSRDEGVNKLFLEFYPSLTWGKSANLTSVLYSFFFGGG